MKNKKKQRKSRVINILIFLLFAVGVGILMYPIGSDLWNQYRNSKLINEYGSTVSNLENEQYAKILNEAQTYNEQHTVNEIVDAFENGEDYILSHPYDTLLNPNQDEVMGYIEIPKIEVKLAIYHGVGSQNLEKGCGHVEGTSLPIGGVGTHAVLAAHRGLPSAKLFTDLDQIDLGDEFYIHVLDETMAYEVDQIKTVMPAETEELQIEHNQDFVTLLTCTPYGVNTHRLLVRGHRVEYQKYEETENTIDKVLHLDFKVKLLLSGILVFGLTVICICIYRKKESKTGRRRKK